MTKRALLTGGNSGIGQHAVAALAQAGWDVVVAARDDARSQAVAARVNDSVGRVAVTVQPLDLASLASVRALAAILAGAPLDALICNAGVSTSRGLRWTADGFEHNVGINHVGHFVLVRALLPTLAPGARVIVVASEAANMTEDHTYMKAPAWPGAEALLRPEGDDPEMDGRRYATSKLCTALFAFELDRRLRSGTLDHPDGVVVGVYEPGFVPGTGLARDEPGFAGWMFRRVLPWMGRWMPVRTAEEAGRGLARMVLDPDLRSGQRFVLDEEREPGPHLTDPERGRELWEVTERLVDAA